VSAVYDQSIQIIESQQKSLAFGGAATTVSPARFIFAPLYVANFICAPFFWQIRKPIHMISALESVIYQFILIYLFANIKAIAKDKTLPFKNSWFMFILITSAIMGVTLTNFGLTVRQRCMVIPFLLLFYSFVRSIRLKRKKMITALS
jgi:hypothetical protein